MNYEEIGKRAVELGYDGGGIWSNFNGWSYWVSQDLMRQEGFYPDFSYPETEGAALAWIAEKKGAKHIFLGYSELGKVFFVSNGLGPIINGRYESGVEAILESIELLGLRKKDNSPMGLNKRLLEVGFRSGGCVWYTNMDSSIIVSDAIIIAAMKSGCVLFPDGSHPSTIGVATAWLRSFEKIGERFHIWKWGAFWRCACDNGQPNYTNGYGSELEALVEFAEWAKAEGLLT